MLNPHRNRAVGTALLLAGLCFLLGRTAELTAGEVLLENGTRIQGTLRPIQALTNELAKQTRGPTNTYPILMVHTGIKRYFVPRRQVLDVDQAVDLSSFETFKLPQSSSGRQLMLRSVGSYSDMTPFDEFGRRRLTLRTAHKPLRIVQGVTIIRPKYLTVTGLTHMWEHGIATTSVPPQILDRMIRRVTDQNNPDDRLAIARFYVQAGLYLPATSDLKSIETDFPELAERVEEVRQNLRESQARRLLDELHRRRRLGQHRLASQAIRKFPVENMSAAVLRQVRKLAGEYDEMREQLGRVRMLLGDLQAQLTDDKQISSAMLRSIVNEELDYESLQRLDAFLKLEKDETLSAAEKLALAYSGWVVGSGNSVTDFPAAVRLWEARFLVLKYLRSKLMREGQDLLVQLKALEGIGPATVAQLIPNLPPPVETPNILPGLAKLIEFVGADRKEPLRYSVLLPIEYSPSHSYPLIVALRPAERSAETELIWWGGTPEKPGESGRRGYIVIAPEFTAEKQTHYDYDVQAHTAVLQSIRDARKRFNVDSDRIFLSGHGMGGTAAFDIGMSHPDLFAGVIPICGFSDGYCKWYWQNAKQLAWYVVGGELDRDSMTRNAREMNRMMRHGFDVIYAEYIGRGYESYYAEIYQLFDWMDRHQRLKNLKEVDVKILRPHDNRFDWVEVHGLPRSSLLSNVLGGSRGGRVSPMILNARISDGAAGRTVIHITSGAESNTIWLSPELVDFDKRLTVRLKGRQKFNDFLSPGIETILDDLKERGDRQKLRWVKLQF